MTDDQIFAIRDSIQAGDGWDGDQWDLTLARAIEAAALKAAAPLPAVAPTPLTAGNFDDSSNGQLAKAVKTLALCAPFPGMGVPWTEAKQKEFAAMLDKYEVAPTPRNASDAPIDYCKQCDGAAGKYVSTEIGFKWERCIQCDGSGNVAPVAAQGDAGDARSEQSKIDDANLDRHLENILAASRLDLTARLPGAERHERMRIALCYAIADLATPVVNQSLTAAPDLAGKRKYTRAEVQQWRDDVAYQCADLAEKYGAEPILVADLRSFASRPQVSAPGEKP